MVERMQAGQIEETHYPRNPLDVLCQQIVAMYALDEWKLDDLAGRGAERGAVRRALRRGARLGARPPRRVGTRRRSSPSCGRASCGTASQGMVRGRTGAQRLAVTNPGTIPDRGLFTVTLPDGTRVGELDEEMVYESRPGETFLLGASTWRIEDITFQKVIVTPAPGQPGKMPFWHGDGRVARSSSVAPSARSPVSCAPAPATRSSGSAPAGSTTAPPPTSSPTSTSRPRPPAWCPTTARSWWSGSATRSATGGCACSRRSAPRCTHRGRWPCSTGWASGGALAVELMWSDDGIVIRLPESVDELPDDELLIDPDEIEELIVSQLPGTAMFASRFRECAARALLLPKRRPDQRTPAVAAAPAVRRPALGRRPLPELPDPPRGHPRVPQRRLRRARPRRGAARPALAQGPARVRRLPAGVAVRAVAHVRVDRRVHVRRATRRSPSAGRRRWPSTAICCATCSAPRSCASSSTPTCWPTSSSSSSAWSTVAPPATPTRRTTSSGCSGRCRSTSSGCGPSTAPR